MAGLPCAYQRDANNAWEPVLPPEDTPERRLYNIILAKNVHTCRPKSSKKDKLGCKWEDEPCTKRFPNPQNREGLHMNGETGRNEYFSFEKDYDGYITAYHPGVALLWNAHTNMQVMGSIVLALYLLKYTAKAEPTAHLDLVDEACAANMGLQDLSPAQLTLAASSMLCRPVSAQEAALILMDVPIAQFSDPVIYIPTKPPDQRRRNVRGFGSLDPIQLYCQRPDELSDLTLLDFYRQYDVRPRSGASGRSCIPINADPDQEPLQMPHINMEVRVTVLQCWGALGTA